MSNRLISLGLAALFVFALQVAGSAQEPPAPAPSATVSPQTAISLDPAAVTRAWLATVPAEKRAKSNAYFEGGYWLILWNFLLSAAIFVFLLTSHISARLRDSAERVTRFKTLQVVLYAIPFVFITSILSFPLNLYENFFREHAYGLATQTFVPWFREQVIALGVQLIAASVGLAVLYWVFRRASRTWWVWGTGVAIVLTMIGLLIAPVFVEPL